MQALHLHLKAHTHAHTHTQTSSGPLPQMGWGGGIKGVSTTNQEKYYLHRRCTFLSYAHAHTRNTHEHTSSRSLPKMRVEVRGSPTWTKRAPAHTRAAYSFRTHTLANACTCMHKNIRAHMAAGLRQRHDEPPLALAAKQRAALNGGRHGRGTQLGQGASLPPPPCLAL